MTTHTSTTAVALKRSTGVAVVEPTAAPRTRDQPSPATSPGRILFLKGRWSAPGDSFTLEAAISVTGDGAASGPIWWRANRVPSVEGVEDVRGRLARTSI